MRAEGTAISSTASDDVDKLEGQDQETVAGSGTHLGGVVAQKRTKVKNSNASEKLTVDVLARRILDYGIVNQQVQLSLGHKQGETVWVHKGADFVLYS